MSLRDKIKANWRQMLQPWQMPDENELAESLAKGRARVDGLQQILGAGPPGTVLEIGCYDGSAAFALAERGFVVYASDVADYYRDQSVDGRGADLVQLRNAISRYTPARPWFLHDDLCRSTLPDRSFDLVCSWDVLEHLIDPAAAFKQMARILKPGGLMYHVYNPFFSLDGGHSLCTLDEPWQHCRAGGDEVQAWLLEHRPSEAWQAMRFYDRCLNRMTLGDMLGHMRNAGLHFGKCTVTQPEEAKAMLTPEIMAEVQALHPSVTETDLLSSFVTVTGRKPPCLDIWRWPGLNARHEQIEAWTSGTCIDFGGADAPLPGAVVVDLPGRGHLDSLDAVTEPVDAVFTSHTIEHLPDVAGTLETFWRIIKPGGRLICHVPGWKTERWRAENYNDIGQTPHLWNFGLSGDEPPPLRCYVEIDRLIGERFRIEIAEHTEDGSILVVGVRDE